MGKIYVEIQGGQVTPLPLPGGAHDSCLVVDVVHVALWA